MRFRKIISVALALVVLLLSLLAFQMFQKTQLIMFDSISLNMPVESFEKVFGKPNEIVEETETGYHNPWRAKNPYLYKTGRLSLPQSGRDGYLWSGLDSIPTLGFLISHKENLWQR